MSEKQTLQIEVVDIYNPHELDAAVHRWSVPRSDGTIDPGWIELGRGERAGIPYAKLTKIEGDKIAERDVPIAKLERIRDEHRRKVSDQLARQAFVDESPYAHLFNPDEDAAVDVEMAAVRPLETEDEQLRRQRIKADIDDAADKAYKRPEMGGTK